METLVRLRDRERSPITPTTFDKQPRLNTLALTEFTLNFCKLCSKLVTFLEPTPTEVDIKVEIRNAFFGDSARLFLIPYPVSSWAFSTTDDRHYAPESSMTRKLVVPTEQLRTGPANIAYNLLRQIFFWFEAEGEIPYTSGPPNAKYVDEQLIINSRGAS